MEAHNHAFIMSVPETHNWSASSSDHFISTNIASNIYLTGTWLGSMSGLDVSWDIIPAKPAWNRTPILLHPASSSLTTSTELSTFLQGKEQLYCTTLIFAFINCRRERQRFLSEFQQAFTNSSFSLL
jgi:hypothetical protein